MEIVASSPNHEKENMLTPQSEMTRLSDPHSLRMGAQDHFTSPEQWPNGGYDYSGIDYPGPQYRNSGDNSAAVILSETREKTYDPSSERKRGSYVANAW